MIYFRLPESLELGVRVGAADTASPPSPPSPPAPAEPAEPAENTAETRFQELSRNTVTWGREERFKVD